VTQRGKVGEEGGFKQGEKKFPVVNIPKQCQLFSPIDIGCREGKALGAEEGIALGSGLCHVMQSGKVSRITNLT
jgi:hypothetical protein